MTHDIIALTLLMLVAVVARSATIGNHEPKPIIIDQAAAF